MDVSKSEFVGVVGGRDQLLHAERADKLMRHGERHTLYFRHLISVMQYSMIVKRKIMQNCTTMKIL